MKKYIFTIILFLLLAKSSFASSLNAGFVPGQIWFSKTPFFAGDNVRIYTAIYNSSDFDISGYVEFSDNDQVISNVEFSMARGTGARDVWADYTATLGEHNFSVKIVDAHKATSNNQYEPVDFGDDALAVLNMFIDGDNDGDMIGNRDDEDDDNDGVDDIKEISYGSNPFVPDHEISSSSEATVASSSGSSNVSGIEEKIQNKVVELVTDYAPGGTAGFLNSINNFFDSQLEVIDLKKQELKERLDISDNKESINAIKEGIKDSGVLSSSTLKDLIGASTTDEFKNTLKDKGAELTEKEVKKNIVNNAGSWVDRIFYIFLVVAGFIINHKIVLFATIFLVIYLILRTIVRFYVD